MLDLSYNLNLKFVKPSQLVASSGSTSSIGGSSSSSSNGGGGNINTDESENLITVSTSSNTLEILNLAGIDLGYLNGPKFLDGLFDKYVKLRVLNLTSTRLKSILTQRWPATIEIVDLSWNFIRDGQFECGQLAKVSKLRRVYLNNNRLKSFPLFLNSCSLLLDNSAVTLDLKFNLFESLEGLTSSADASNAVACPVRSNMTVLLLDGNPLVFIFDSFRYTNHLK